MKFKYIKPGMDVTIELSGDLAERYAVMEDIVQPRIEFYLSELNRYLEAPREAQMAFGQVDTESAKVKESILKDLSVDKK